MAQQVSMGAMMKCSFGLAPSSLIVLVPTVLECVGSLSSEEIKFF